MAITDTVRSKCMTMPPEMTVGKSRWWNKREAACFAPRAEQDNVTEDNSEGYRKRGRTNGEQEVM